MEPNRYWVPEKKVLYRWELELFIDMSEKLL